MSNLPCLAGVLRDDFRPDSDVDVLVTYKLSHRLTLSNLLSMQEEIEHLFHRSVDLVEKNRLENPYRRSNAPGTRSPNRASRSEKGAVPETSPLFRQELLIAVVGMIRLNL
ncbi:nucleotidyltransferase family protein [Microcoleus vaginatus]|uniref:nucleotidyltransferase family protein n=1 Tax=Microcoleus vaginatus TaxID=119532 RepID=UPI0032A32861